MRMGLKSNEGAKLILVFQQKREGCNDEETLAHLMYKAGVISKSLISFSNKSPFVILIPPF